MKKSRLSAALPAAGLLAALFAPRCAWAVACRRPPAPPDGAAGPRGRRGPRGEDGALRIYGDGSAGDRVIAGDSGPRRREPAVRDFTVPAGVRLTVPSGAVLRCTGAFTNYGTIVVGEGVLGGYSAARGGRGRAAPARRRRPGPRRAAADSGEAGDAPGAPRGPRRRGPPGALQARALLRPGLRGGGGGGGGSSFAGVLAPGGGGGGTLVVLARGGIETEGTIRPPAATGARGRRRRRRRRPRAGLAGPDPEPRAPHGARRPRRRERRGGGPGGGGGGGIVHLLGPRIAPEGAVSVDGGEAGAQGGAGSISGALRQGGGGGGACGGGGGAGGGVTAGAAASPLPAQGGGVGMSLRTAADPTALF